MWKRLASRVELSVDLTLNGGQCFTWIKTGERQWSKVVDGRILSIKQEGDEIFYRGDGDGDGDSSSSSKLHVMVHEYFQMHVDLPKYYASWSESDANFKKHAASFSGLRILKQDPVENVFSFICATCNNIDRITQMVNNMCQKYGKHVGDVEGKAMFSFPEVAVLAKDGMEEELRNLNFGYRAKYIHQSAKLVQQNGGPEWLNGLRKLSYEETVKELMTLPGVGRKVADCIALFSMDKPESVPVDTHIWQIATRDYALVAANKTLTDRIYLSIASLFRNLYGPYAGWANTVLFTADLRRFEDMHAASKSKKKTPPAQKQKFLEGQDQQGPVESGKRTRRN